MIGPRRALLAARTLRWAPRATAVDVDELVAATAPVGTSSLPAEPSAGRRGGDPVHVGRHRAGQGRACTAIGSSPRNATRSPAPTASPPTIASWRPSRPFALYGPALGIPTCLPDCDVTKPARADGSGARRRLRAHRRHAGVRIPVGARQRRGDRCGGVPTWPGLAGLRTVFSAGAPVPPETLHAVADLAPSASLHTPYGMTEVLPVADIDLAGDRRGPARRPDGRRLRRSSGRGRVRSSCRTRPPTETARSSSTAPWVSDGYLDLWDTQHRARLLDGDVVWHRSGDVGHLDDAGRLWVEGRTRPRHPQRVAARSRPSRSSVWSSAAWVSLGRRRSASARSVSNSWSWSLEDRRRRIRAWRAPPRPTQVRRLIERPVAAVLTLRRLPVDIRHNAKIDRDCAWPRGPTTVLAGRRARPPKMRVLVTGASSLIGAASPRRWHVAATRWCASSADRVGNPERRACRDRGAR